jgi:chitinase
MQKLTPIVAALFLLIAVSARATPDRVVVGYSATWRDSSTPPECYNFDAITHLARAFLAPHPDGTIEVPDGYFNPSMESLARKHGVKLLMSIGGEASNADNWLSIARNPECFQRFKDGLANLLSTHGYDGIDIDWEPSALTTEDGDAYISLLKGLRARFADRIITTALPAGEYWVSHFAWKEVVANVDYVNVMTYDYSGGWGGRAAYCSSLFPAGAYVPEPTLSDAEGMQNLIENHQVPPAKLLMGMTFWPSRFAVDHIGDHFPVNGADYSMNITYAQAMCLLSTGEYKDFWDEKAAMPYLQRGAGGSVVCYESPRSIQRKCQYAAKLGCAGVMIWHLGADVDGGAAPLMDAVADSFGAPKQTFARQMIERQIAEFRGEIRDLKSKIKGPANPPANESPTDLSTLPDDQLQALLARIETEWGVAQGELWEQDAPQKQGK